MLTVTQRSAREKCKFKGIFCSLPPRIEMKLMFSRHINVSVYHMTIFLSYNVSLTFHKHSPRYGKVCVDKKFLIIDLSSSHLALLKPLFPKSLSRLVTLPHPYLYPAINYYTVIDSYCSLYSVGIFLFFWWSLPLSQSVSLRRYPPH